MVINLKIFIQLIFKQLLIIFIFLISCDWLLMMILLSIFYIFDLSVRYKYYQVLVLNVWN